ncbi:hypothetical protein Ahy_B06g082505 [Arachis hypogaea]|uniref:Ubiquitin-like protease family profile domain-containing protein n=1 Tax=Arachis hypogaea TaxID=3818 RepID=A0A444YNP2_ARAHY|nr:hypothetical protein Ahy_B06g082505 [Arachis hypogaea]
MGELIEQCYHWMTHVKQSKDNSNEYDALFVLKHEALYEGVRQHFMSLMPKEQVESMVFTTHSMILNEIKCHLYQEQIYIVPLDILFVPVCNRGHWWLWMADVKKKAFYVLDSINKEKKDIAESRVKLNKFVGLIISQMRVYAGAEPLMEDGEGEEAEYIMLNSQRTDICVMKWLETIDPQKIKSGTRYKYRAWTQLGSFLM